MAKLIKGQEQIETKLVPRNTLIKPVFGYPLSLGELACESSRSSPAARSEEERRGAAAFAGYRRTQRRRYVPVFLGGGGRFTEGNFTCQRSNLSPLRPPLFGDLFVIN